MNFNLHPFSKMWKVSKLYLNQILVQCLSLKLTVMVGCFSTRKSFEK